MSMPYHKGKRRLRIMIVEDDPLMVVDLERMLTNFGHEVVGARTSVEGALDFAETAEIDLAIVDLELSDKGFGGDVVELLNRRHGVPSVIVSGRLTQANREAVDSVGVAGMIQKPCNEMTLRAVVTKAAKAILRTSA